MALLPRAIESIRAEGRVWQHTIGFSVLSLLVFSLSVTVLASLDLLPEARVVDAKSPVASVQPQDTGAVIVPELPQKIVIARLSLTATVANPDTTVVAKLDEALTTGTVRYPTSAKLGADGNVIIFGHSSYLPVVNNKAFKAFNEIQKLTSEDRILVIGATRTYVYQVATVNKADAETDGIPLTVSGQILTLVTCESFGKKSDRFIVTARLVESYPNAS